MDVEDALGSQAWERAVAAILDWRDRDTRPRLQGAEDTAYAAAGLPYGAADNVFLMVEELDRVLGIDKRIYRYLRPLVTVHSRQAKVYPGSAPRPVLLALPGVGEAEVDEYLAERGVADLSRPTRRIPPQFHAARRYLTPAPRPIYTISGEGKTAGGTTVRRSAVVRITRNRKRPYLIVGWSDDVDEAVFNEDEAVLGSESNPSAAEQPG